MRPPRITVPAQVARAHDARGAIVIVFDHNGFASASWGATRAECTSLGRLLDQLAEGLQSGTLGPVFQPPPEPRS